VKAWVLLNGNTAEVLMHGAVMLANKTLVDSFGLIWPADSIKGLRGLQWQPSSPLLTQCGTKANKILPPPASSTNQRGTWAAREVQADS